MKRELLLSLGMVLIVGALARGQDLPEDQPAAAPKLVMGEPASSCGPRLWGGVDYLMWWIRSGSTPPLVTTGPATDPFPGALDQANTQVLFGGRELGYGMFNGMRTSLGGWLDSDGVWGVEASGFVLERRSAGFRAQADANGQPYLAAPFINANSGNDNVYFIAQNFANGQSALLTGGVRIASPTQLWSWEVSGAANAVRDGAGSVNLLLGFRQLSLREDLTYRTAAENLAVGGAASFLGMPLAPGFTVSTFDRFQCANLFNGGQLGVRIDRRWGAFSIDAVGKLGLGAMHQEVTVQGQSFTTAPVPVTQAAGGIYAQGSNIGVHERDVFAVIPEVGINLSWYVTSNLRARIGYTFLYVSSVARPGDQIDTHINPNVVPIDGGFGTPGGVNRPAFEFHSTGFWAQGLNFGLEFAY